ncbi:MAG: S-methyl-5-thioribose kinase, partial [Halomonadaceae bacterium]
LFPKSLFEEQGNSADDACDALLEEIRLDALAYCGIEMHRRVLSLAHNADFEEIEDTGLRAKLEARNVLMGQALILEPEASHEVSALIDLAQAYNRQDVL